MNTLASLVVGAIAVIVTAYLLPGVTVDGFLSALVAAVVLAVVNGLIRPILLFLTLPINLLTLGLFTFVIVGLCVMLVSAIVPGFEVAGFLWALAFALVLAIVNAALGTVTARPITA